MEHFWSQYEGQVAENYPLQSYLGVRHSRGFFLTEHDGAPALLQIVSTSPAQQDIWTRALALDHPNLMRVYKTGKAALGGLRVGYAVSQLPDDDLSEILPKRKLTPDEAEQVAASMHKALDYLHGQNLVSGSVRPDNIFAVGDTIKLGVDHIQINGDLQHDRRQLEATLLELGAGARPSVLVMPSQSAPSSSPKREFSKHWLWAGAAVAAAASMVFVTHRNATIPIVAAPPVQAALPSPLTEHRSRAVDAPPPKQAPAPAIREGYIVVAAAYKNAPGAERRAAEMQRQHPKFRPQVTSASGGRYLVTLGTGLTMNEAKRIHTLARSSGLPKDVYITKF